MPSKRDIQLCGTFLIVGIILGYTVSYFLPPATLLRLWQNGGGERVGNSVIKTDESSSDVSLSDSAHEIPTPCDNSVEVAGAVNVPGVYCFTQKGLVSDAVKKAKGLNRLAARRYVEQKINMAGKLSDGLKIYIPYEDDLMCERVKFQLENTLDKYLSTSDDEEGDSGECIHINQADQKALEGLPGVGEVTAKKIIDSRPYQTLESIKELKIVSEKIYFQISESICL